MRGEAQAPVMKAQKAARITFPFTSLRLLLPAIAPSWRFFDSVSDSPRVDYAVLATPDEVAGHWQEFRPRPAVVSPFTMLRRFLWNPQWNENLFLVSLAERMVSPGTPETDAHSERELLLRIARHLHLQGACAPGSHLQIRLRFISRAETGNGIVSHIAYVSSPRLIAELI